MNVSAVRGVGTDSLSETSDARQAIYLQAGQLAVSREPLAISTILGSCVAVCVWDCAIGAGGMTHYMLPQWGSTSGAPNARYGNIAIKQLFDTLFSWGCRPATLSAKLFGGAAMLAVQERTRESLGSQNVTLAERMLDELRVSIVERDVEGLRGRKLIFHTDDGTSLVKRL